MEENHMLEQHPAEQPPSYAQAHAPDTLQFPSVPTTELPPIHPERILPPLPDKLPEPSYRPTDVLDHKHASSPWPNTNPLAAYYQGSPSQASPTSKSITLMDSPSAMEIDAATPDSRGRRGGSVLSSIDDPDVRLAAEALGDLRADFIQSPQSSERGYLNGQSNAQQPEPLLSLLTTSHPILGTAIGGSLSAYSASKNYSPRFKSGAEYVERRFTPVVNTVGSVGRVTGVEGGVRWFLGGRRPSHNQPSDFEERDQGPHKRRRVGEDTDMNVDNARDSHSVSRQDFYPQHRQRQPSQGSTVESLPAYDDYRSPSYEANARQALIPTQPNEPSTGQGSTWQSRLMLSTSGLSVAMSEESLRSLKYCLGWLRWANEHIGKVISALKSLLEQYDSSASSAGAITNGESQNQDGSEVGPLVVRTDAERTVLNAKIAELKTDVLKTLKDVVDVVSKYAGGALPENARILVRRHLTSLPQRFKLASTNTNPENGERLLNSESEAGEGARRVMVLAKEGLDMMAQVSGVLDGTIASAEEWCERLGRKNRGESDGEDGVKEPLPVAEAGEYRRPINELHRDEKMG